MLSGLGMLSSCGDSEIEIKDGPVYDKATGPDGIDVLLKDCEAQKKEDCYFALCGLVVAANGSVDGALEMAHGKTASEIIKFYRDNYEPKYDQKKDNIDEIRRFLPVGMQKRFDDAQFTLYMTIGQSGMHGMTGREILERAEKVEAERRSSAAASSGPRFDVNNPDSSMKAMLKSCSLRKGERFGKALQKLTFTYGNQVGQVIHGKTVDEIIDMAN